MSPCLLNSRAQGLRRQVSSLSLNWGDGHSRVNSYLYLQGEMLLHAGHMDPVLMTTNVPRLSVFRSRTRSSGPERGTSQSHSANSPEKPDEHCPALSGQLHPELSVCLSPASPCGSLSAFSGRGVRWNGSCSESLSRKTRPLEGE